MAFVFTVETGAVVTGANSYVAVATADDYFVVDPAFSAVWAAYTTTQKQYRLALASRTLDQRVVWAGVKAVETSPMRWPRDGVYDRDGAAIDDDEIPIQLQEAVLEMVKYMVTSSPTTAQDVEFLKRVEMDVMEIEFQDGQGQVSVPPHIIYTIGSLGVYQTGGGHRFSKIVKV